jgi:pimeloyl-ACP methyl ester carboxylesterase
MATSEPPVPSGRYIQCNGLSIFYEEYGSGKPLLLIHGGTVNHSMWVPHIPALARHFRVIAPDSRGHGRTKNPSDFMSYRLLADDMASFVQALELEQPSVCGFSDGGQIALEMGMRYPQLAHAYVICAATYRWPGAYCDLTKALGMEGPGVVNLEKLERDRPEFINRLKEQHDVFQGTDYWKTYLRQLSTMWLAPLNYTAEDLQKITAPTLILGGDHDDATLPVEDATALYRLIPQAELAIVPGADHFFPWAKIDIFTQLILDFLLRYQVTPGS